MSEIGQEIIAEVRRIAAAQPDYVYDLDNCAYMLEGKPSCIMGHALFNLGHLPGDEAEGNAIDEVLSLMDLDIDPSESAWLYRVQAAQDGPGASISLRTSWGEAVLRADTRSPLSD